MLFLVAPNGERVLKEESPPLQNMSLHSQTDKIVFIYLENKRS